VDYPRNENITCHSVAYFDKMLSVWILFSSYRQSHKQHS